MSKLGIVGSTVAQQILLLVTSTFGAGKEAVRMIDIVELPLFANENIVSIKWTYNQQMFLLTLVAIADRRLLFLSEEM